MPFSGILHRNQKNKLAEELFDPPEWSRNAEKALFDPPEMFRNAEETLRGSSPLPLAARSPEEETESRRQRVAANPEIGIIADCARKQLRFMRKNNELLKNSSAIRYYE